LRRRLKKAPEGGRQSGAAPGITGGAREEGPAPGLAGGFGKECGAAGKDELMVPDDGAGLILEPHHPFRVGLDCC